MKNENKKGENCTWAVSHLLGPPTSCLGVRAATRADRWAHWPVARARRAYQTRADPVGPGCQ
jgi:hypothetical protein